MSLYIPFSLAGKIDCPKCGAKIEISTSLTGSKVLLRYENGEEITTELFDSQALGGIDCAKCNTSLSELVENLSN